MEFSPKKPIKNRKICSVYGCKSRANKNRTIRFHKFPKKGERQVLIKNKLGEQMLGDKLDAWIRALRIGVKITTNMYVCSLHFRKNDYKSDASNKLKRYLKSQAVPSCNLPATPVHGSLGESSETSSARKRRQKLREDRRHKRMSCMKELFPQDLDESLNLREESIQLPDHEHNIVQCSQEFMEYEREPSPRKLSAAEILLELANTPPTIKIYCDKSVQVKSGDITIPFILCIENDKILSSLTGIPNFKILDHLTGLVEKYYPDKRKHHLTVKERIIMTFMKLKLDLTFTVLSILFKYVSIGTCRLYFYSCVRQVASILRPLIRWVSRKEIKNNMPIDFKNFENVTIVLDCTECFIQRPKCLKCRIKCYSHYKSNLTVKFMTGVTPGGLISFCSKAYGGRSSDQKIFQQSNLINLLKKNSEIMVDRGFLIDDLCAAKNIKIIRPPFLKNKKQFAKSDAIRSRNIARARVHVERVNQRIKDFDILANKIEWNLLSYIDDIFIMICGIVNLSAPVLGDYKFM